jgi:hypothetical protein
LIKKHSKKLKRNTRSTLFRQKKKENDENQLKRVSMSYVPEVTDKIKTVFKQHNMEVVCSSDNKLKAILGSTKDKVDILKKTGIYEVTCGDCEDRYIGQTKRNIHTRFKEHLSHIKYNRPTKSCVAAHALNNDHFDVSLAHLALKKSVYKIDKLDAWESYLINKCENCMNADNGNIESPLFAIV